MKHFTYEENWKKRHAVNCAERMFDAFGWREGWVGKKEIAKALWPNVETATARNYLRALCDFLLEEGKRTKEPQIEVDRLAIRFDIAGSAE